MEGTGKQGQGQWQWQEAGTSWKGVGIYHLTLTIPSREPLLGKLVIPNNDPTQARIERTELGQALLDCQRSVEVFHPEIQILQYSLMPDHLHSIWYVRRPMQQSIRYVAQGFWRAAKKIGRGHSYLNAGLTGGTMDEKAGGNEAGQTGGTMNEKAGGNEAGQAGGTRGERQAGGTRGENQAGSTEAGQTGGARGERQAGGERAGQTGGARDEKAGGAWGERAGLSLSFIAPGGSRENPLRGMLGGEAYSRLFPIFTEVPFIRPLSRRGQLRTMIEYVQMNPQRLATKHLMPGYFRVQKGIEIAGQSYAGVGNVGLLQAAHYATVHVRHHLVDDATRGNSQPLRDYMNGCILAARQGTVMVSPFISPREKDIKAVLLAEGHPFIVLEDNGFRDFYKPSGDLFDAVAAGRVLILSPWEYDANKRHISRAECVALNGMAEQIAAM